MDDLLLPSNGRRGVEILHGTVQTYFWHASRKNPYEFTSLGGALLRNKSSQVMDLIKEASKWQNKNVVEYAVLFVFALFLCFS